ncbi:MAG: flagellar M-ring protein FliF [Lentisphaeraceae bacterium]|nr:flagellar M-ring protein FliF [Lentisphaeraceae bacterium]
MNEQIKNFLEVSKGIWSSLGNFQKASILAIGLLCVSGLSVVVYYGSQPQWHPLYTGVDHANMAKIRDVLMDENVPYRLKSGGNTIEVPVQFVTEMKLKVKSEGDIVIDASGADPLDYINNIPMGMAQEEKKIAWLKAQQLNLESQINQMPKIIGSDVSLNIPKRRPFEKMKESTASVMLNIRQGDYVSPSQVESIRHLVSSAVHNLNSNNVTVVDSNGRLLARLSTDSASKGAVIEDSRREMKARLEHHLQTKVQDILAPAVGGLAKVVAKVDVALDFQNEKRTVEEFKKEESVATKEEVTTEVTNSGVLSQSQGAVGTAGNKAVKIAVSNPDAAPGGGGGNNLSRNVSIKTYDIPKTVSVILKDGAEVKKISVAVNIASPAEGEWGAQQLAKFEELVKNAVGWVNDASTNRMDSVSIIETKFNLPEAVAPAAPAIGEMVDQVDHYMDTNIARNIMGGLLLVALLIFYKKIFSSDKIESQDIVTGGAGAGNEVFDSEGNQVNAIGTMAEEAELALMEGEFDAEMEALKEATNSHPQSIATVIENWVLKEPSNG